MASPVVALNRRYTLRPAVCAVSPTSRPNRLVDANAAATASAFACTSTHAFNAAASARLGIAMRGARVIPSEERADTAPPALRMAAHPRLVDASRAPSVVAMGTQNGEPSSRSGPTTPTG